MRGGSKSGRRVAAPWRPHAQVAAARSDPPRGARSPLLQSGSRCYRAAARTPRAAGRSAQGARARPRSAARAGAPYCCARRAPAGGAADVRRGSACARQAPGRRRRGARPSVARAGRGLEQHAPEGLAYALEVLLHGLLDLGVGPGEGGPGGGAWGGVVMGRGGTGGCGMGGVSSWGGVGVGG
jgi:hypothetical protein